MVREKVKKLFAYYRAKTECQEINASKKKVTESSSGVTESHSLTVLESKDVMKVTLLKKDTSTKTLLT